MHQWRIQAVAMVSAETPLKERAPKSETIGIAKSKNHPEVWSLQVWLEFL